MDESDEMSTGMLPSRPSRGSSFGHSKLTSILSSFLTIVGPASLGHFYFFGSVLTNYTCT